jgi:O-antigen/teichoic acid export membrane protein
VISTALRFMAVSTALRFPYALYSAGLYGLQRHIILNAVLCGATTIRAAGTIVVVTLIARDVRVLFAWEMIASLLLTGAAAAALHHVMPGDRHDGRFDLGLLADARAFMVGVGAIGILAALNTQIDKLAVSKLLPLRTFGYYTIGTMLAAAVVAVVSPIWLTVFPRFSQLVAQRDELNLAAVYHRAAQALAVVLLPIVAIIIFFGRDIVELWTGDAVAASETRWLIVLLVAGAALNALMSVPYALQLANAWTTPALLVNGLGVVLLFPATIVATKLFGAVGAASCWLVFHFTSFVIGMTMTHARFLRGHRGRWLWRGVVLPAAVAILVCAAGRLLISGGSRVALVSLIAVTAAAALLATALSTPVVYEWIAEQRHRRQSPGGRG